MSDDSTHLRRAILDTTRHLMIAHGYQGLSMRKIAREMGYSATSIYLHFEGKDDLFHTLIDEGMEQLYEHLRATSDEHTGPAVERMRSVCRAYVDFGLENPEYYEVMFMLHPEHMERYPADKYRRARRNLDVFAEILEAGAVDGDVMVSDPRVSASTVWAALHGTVSLLIAERVDVRIDRDAFVDTAIEQALRGVARSEPV